MTCVYIGNHIWVKGIKLYERKNEKLNKIKWRHSCGQSSITKQYTARPWFFTTSTSSGILATNVSFQYWTPRRGGYRKKTETSTESSNADQTFSRPYHGPRQFREDNHPTASLQYNRTAENFQSGGTRGIPCSRHHHLKLLMRIDWLVWAQSNYPGNVVLRSLLLCTEDVAEREAWYREWNDIRE